MFPDRRRPALRGVVVFAVAILIPVAGASAVARQSASVPAQLVGKWTRTPTAADVNRAGAKGVAAGTVYVFIVKKSGAAVIGSTYGGFAGKVVPAGTNRIHINVGTPVQNLYVWHASGSQLTLKKVKDSEPDRVAVMVGVWKRS